MQNKLRLPIVLFLLIAQFFVFVAPSQAAAPSSSLSALAIQTGYKLPFPAGLSYPVTKVGVNHGAGRNAIDFGLNYNSVSAMKAGYVRGISNSTTTGGGKYVKVDHGSYCSHYYHLSTINVSKGVYVKQGQIIATSGNTGTNSTGPHLHVSLMADDANNTCPWNTTKEYPIGFVEYGNLAITAKSASSKVSQNTIPGSSPAPAPALTPAPAPTPAPSPTFTTSANSTITITTIGVTLKVCDSNLAGKTVYATLYRDAAYGYAAKTWFHQLNATSGCVTFSDMDGAGNTFQGVTYYTTASLSPISSADSSSKRTSCFSATGRRQLCDAVRR